MPSAKPQPTSGSKTLSVSKSRASSPAKPLASRAKPSSIRSTFSELADDVLLSEREASDVAGYGPLTFKRWRKDKKGPPWLRINGGVRYRAKALRDWLDGLSSDAA
jgi:hypothetical protein